MKKKIILIILIFSLSLLYKEGLSQYKINYELINQYVKDKIINNFAITEDNKVWLLYNKTMVVFKGDSLSQYLLDDDASGNLEDYKIIPCRYEKTNYYWYLVKKIGNNILIGREDYDNKRCVFLLIRNNRIYNFHIDKDIEADNFGIFNDIVNNENGELYINVTYVKEIFTTNNEYLKSYIKPNQQIYKLDTNSANPLLKYNEITTEYININVYKSMLYILVVSKLSDSSKSTFNLLKFENDSLKLVRIIELSPKGFSYYKSFIKDDYLYIINDYNDFYKYNFLDNNLTIHKIENFSYSPSSINLTWGSFFIYDNNFIEILRRDIFSINLDDYSWKKFNNNDLSYMKSDFAPEMVTHLEYKSGKLWSLFNFTDTAKCKCNFLIINIPDFSN